MHNIVTVIMEELGLGLQDAIDYVGRLHDSHVQSFLELYGQMSEELGKTDHPINTNALSYIESLGNWVRGNDQWSFEVCFPRSFFFFQYRADISRPCRCDVQHWPILAVGMYC